MKRCTDLLLAILLFFPALVVCSFCSILIFLECRANPLFIQIRVGRHMKPFALVKLRTMIPGTANVATHEVGPDQVMKVGRLLRTTKIDELPQILNVLAGHMSFVGPRPCLFHQEELVKERVARSVFSIRPGITGKAQILGVDMSEPIRLANLDAHYMQNMGFNQDLSILLATFTGKGSGDALHMH